ncbi:MAG: hypothetical protein EPN14_00520 [Gallionella sp.]|nr:MAG: hypothetical protein EPN14_00520 [Gallionella sp.]
MTVLAEITNKEPEGGKTLAVYQFAETLLLKPGQTTTVGFHTEIVLLERADPNAEPAPATHKAAEQPQITLTQPERLAVLYFLEENWEAFTAIAARFIDGTELSVLEKKLSRE